MYFLFYTLDLTIRKQHKKKKTDRRDETLKQSLRNNNDDDVWALDSSKSKDIPYKTI